MHRNYGDVWVERIPLVAEDGWRDSLTEARASRHPGCAASVASRHSFDGAALLKASPYRARASRPPLRGGEYYATIITKYCT